MEITVTTEKYTAQELQKEIDPNRSFMWLVFPGENTHEYIIIVANEIQAKLAKGMLKHIGIEA